MLKKILIAVVSNNIIITSSDFLWLLASWVPLPKNEFSGSPVEGVESTTNKSNNTPENALEVMPYILFLQNCTSIIVLYKRRVISTKEGRNVVIHKTSPWLYLYWLEGSHTRLPPIGVYLCGCPVNVLPGMVVTIDEYLGIEAFGHGRSFGSSCLVVHNSQANSRW